MKKFLTFPLIALAYTIFNGNGAYALERVLEPSDQSLVEKLMYSDAIEDFWIGDDGESCSEPIISLLNRDTASNAITIKIEKTGTAVGCYETPYVCQISYTSGIDNEITFHPVDLFTDCRSL